MTLIQKSNDVETENMDGLPTKDDGGKSLRPVRNRRYTRRSLVAGQRPQKRLFTPEIKRYLKDWLVRRRENPYPNREEKKNLADETGLTYIQICNWFANWRRKLKNVNAHRNQQTWGHLIRTYNDRAQGNVEQFSLCSEDSIWSEPDPSTLESEVLDIDTTFADNPVAMRESPHEDLDNSTSLIKCDYFHSYDFERNNTNCNDSQNPATIASPLLLSKWLKSAARFQPSETNYSCWLNKQRPKSEPKIQRVERVTWNKLSRHDQDEVEAAVALTALATAGKSTTT